VNAAGIEYRDFLPTIVVQSLLSTCGMALDASCFGGSSAYFTAIDYLIVCNSQCKPEVVCFLA
jgi:hypothetical protein